jgi:hypothetical protein
MPDQDSTRVTEVTGDAAVNAFCQLPETRAEILVNCHYTGKQTLSIHFGTIPDGRGYVYLEGSEAAPRLMTANGEDVAKLFKGGIDYIEMCQSSVNSDPRSPDYFHPDPDVEELPSLFAERLGVHVGDE